MQTIKNKHLKLADQIKNDKLKLKSLRYLINKENKKQVQYFDKIANLEETEIDYNKSYYKSGNKRNFEEFGTMADLFPKKNKFEKITLGDAELKLVELNYQLNSLENTIARKQTYKDKKAKVLKNAKSLFEGQKLIYSGFIDKTFTIGDEFSTPKPVTPRDKIPDIGIREILGDEEETPIDMLDLETEESAEERRNQRGQDNKCLVD